ncbi:MAG: hypothetical protein M3Z30_02115 [Gemmatimonadota bacterium]|nr:hypothetical protein [Gemmatimonadota bacterium]
MITSLFRSNDVHRDKYLARVFGIVSEQIVRLWAALPAVPYTFDPVRPTLFAPGESRGRTLDFLLRDRDNRVFVAELKCELEYRGYRYLTLTDPEQLTHHASSKAAFRHFLAFAAAPDTYTVRSAGHVVSASGAILIWGDATPEGRVQVRARYQFADVLTLADMIRDLQDVGSTEYQAWLSDRWHWSHELWRGLGLRQSPDARGRETVDVLIAQHKAIIAGRFGVDPQLVSVSVGPDHKNWWRVVIRCGEFYAQFGAWPTILHLPHAAFAGLVHDSLRDEEIDAILERLEICVGGIGADYFASDAAGRRADPELKPDFDILMVTSWLGVAPEPRAYREP